MSIKPIESVSDAIDLINSKEFKNFIKIDNNLFPQLPVYNKPFGIWFRGENDDWNPVPTVFRQGKRYDETSMFYHFQSRAGHKNQCRNTFDWLCLIRHFELPTRLLDWSENILTALFFASECPEINNGKLHILNALKLNAKHRIDSEKKSSNNGIAIPVSVDTAIRAEMVHARSIFDLIDSLYSFNRNYVENFKSLMIIRKELKKEPKTALDQLKKPIAVLPLHLDTRIALQQSAFTIHGGKVYEEEGGVRINNASRLPEPNSLEYLNNNISSPEEKFLYSINVNNKEKIREELNYMGIHNGSLFPELDHQSKHITKCWSYGS